MKLNFKTTNPSKLKSDILKSIDEGDLKTWSIYEFEGLKYIKHTPQWGDKGVVKMDVDITNNQLVVQVFKFKSITQDVKDFEGYYLGRFCELVFVNFTNSFTSIIKN